MTITGGTTRVLVPRSPDPTQPISSAIRAAGFTPIVVPFVSTAAPHDPAPLASAAAHLRDGEADWLVLTSSRVLPALHRAGLQTVPSTVRVAAVGPATARRAQRTGIRIDLIPEGSWSADGLASALLTDQGRSPGGAPHAIVPHSDLARPTITTRLREAGWCITDVTAYRTELVSPLHPSAQDIAAVVLTSSSTATAWARHRTRTAPQGPAPLVICLGEASAHTARQHGLVVSAVADRPDPDAVTAALAAVLRPGRQSRPIPLASPWSSDHHA